MDATVQALQDTRERTLALVDHLPAADLERQVDPVMSPLVWDLAHIAAYEDLWLCHRHGGEPHAEGVQGQVRPDPEGHHGGDPELAQALTEQHEDASGQRAPRNA